MTSPRHDSVCSSAALPAVVENEGKCVERSVFAPHPAVLMEVGNEAVPTTTLGFAA
jgi:hypothetical protein